MRRRVRQRKAVSYASASPSKRRWELAGDMTISEQLSADTFSEAEELFSDSEELPQLTSQELRILMKISTGLTAKQVASIMTISTGTVRKHLEHAYRKLDCSDRLMATRKAERLRLF
jgi:DNA-binding NarL/FixJ family response regulator